MEAACSASSSTRWTMASPRAESTDRHLFHAADRRTHGRHRPPPRMPPLRDRKPHSRSADHPRNQLSRAQGPHGIALRAVVARDSHFAQIAKVLKRIHEDYSRDLQRRGAGGEAKMSVSAFHHNFKAVTSSSPLQYIKSIRLHKARCSWRRKGWARAGPRSAWATRAPRSSRGSSNASSARAPARTAPLLRVTAAVHPTELPLAQVMAALRARQAVP